MNLRYHHVLLSLGKELRETLRDRRTLMIMILFPLVLYPLMALVGTQVVAGRERSQAARASLVTIAGTGAAADEIRTRITSAPKLFELRPAGQLDDVDAGRLDALVTVTAAAATERATVEIAFDATRPESRRAEDRLGSELSGIWPTGCAPRFDLQRRDLAPGTRVGGYILSKALPLMILLMVLLGAFYPAIDVTAGERERGTLETVLTSPIRRMDLLLGKVLAVTLLASASGFLNLGSMTLTLVQMVQLADPGTQLPIPWSRAAATGLVVLPTAFLLAALFVAVGSLARGFKEAQNLLVPVYFLFFAPAMLGSLGDFPLTGVAAIVPGMNVSLLARDIALGKATLGTAAVVLGTTLIAGGIALGAAARLYVSERFLAAADEPRPRRRGGPLRAEPLTAGEALALFGLGIVLLYFVFIPLQRRSLISGLLISEWGGLVVLVVLVARLTRRSVGPMLGLRAPAGRHLLGAALMGLGGWVIADLAALWIAPPPKEYLEALRRMLFPELGARGLPASLFLFAVTPAVCEEVFFRGAILRGLLKNLTPFAALLLCAGMFALFHVDVWRLLPTGLLGLMLSYIAWRSDSLWPSILAHTLNNGVVVVLGHVGMDKGLETLGSGAQAGLLAAAAVVVATGALLLARRATTPTQM